MSAICKERRVEIKFVLEKVKVKFVKMEGDAESLGDQSANVT